MTKVTPSPQTKHRKADHIRINLEEDVQSPRLTTGLARWRFMHQAVPELDFAAIDTRVTVFGRTLASPILISSMTGGTPRARTINRTLARAAQEARIAMGVGSQRAMIEAPDLAPTFQVRDVAPDILLLANLGAVQLNYGYGVDECRRAVEQIQADALILHLNPLQEALQPEGDGNFTGLLAKIEAVCAALEVPVIAKEVGWGISPRAARQLADAGVAAIDVAGAGGTSWSEVERHRAESAVQEGVARAFADWGIPTAETLRHVRQAAPDVLIFASGGLRDGVEIAKCLALGAELGGLAGPFLKAADRSEDTVRALIEELTLQLRVTMFAAGAGSIAELQRTPLYPAGSL